MAKTSVIARSLKKVKFKTRKRNRCQICGRPRGFIKMFGVCRICFRILAHRGELPGIRKASW